ncbi:arf-GAP with Rho-GAP domain, ANK repeat and PH domain-containing protein 1-like isoform X14 [Oncorhynchus keta]|uniref:arf-GAP with Rho-GAP domain, ANK repeat and PH domain-containing protein 1-like isoform X14 n=1 Tax=Oncorhynchus keta TaxID=8018 RepID=UPI00227C45CA|nr:arf-GAP with Rho-GAP domain, ANK repeat and PH domain-containing protein 1-like isoform X14 [Oncorhynchus keta]
MGEGGRKPSPVSSSSSSSSFSVEQYDHSSSSDQCVPTLPPKVYVVGAGPKEPRGPAPIPRQPPVLPPRTTHSDAPVNEPHTERTPPPLPRTRVHNTPVDTQPALPMRRIPQPPPEIRSDFGDSSDDSEDPDQVYPKPQSVNMADRDVFLPVPGWGKGRYSSLCSDDELLDDDNEPISNRQSSWQDYGLSTLQESVYLPVTGRVLAQPPRDGPSPVLKMGWLDKNPPQGSLYYQRRWVKLDVDYLRYFDNDKEVYSKRIIPTAAITGVTNVGEQKFEVVTTNRTFLFRAESDFERNEWVSVLQNFTKGGQEGSREITSSAPHSLMTPGSPLTPEQQGYLELRGLRSKLYTVVSGDKVFLYKNMEDYRLGIGITSIDMNVGNVKDTDRRSFDLTTPYRIFSFLADSEQHKDQWVEAMREAIGEALSNSEVANQIWAEPSNGCCADCGAAKPEWAAINLCVVVCKRCAGEHRGLGPSISKVRSLKMDRRVWTEELIQVFLLLGNERLNRFWAANVPPSEALSPTSCSEDRRRFVSSKYRQGKYRKYHPLYGNQEELNNALCINVQCSDVLETLCLVFCGADVNCSTGQADCPSPLSLALAHNQKLQAQFLSHNLNTVCCCVSAELPRSEVTGVMEPQHYSPQHPVTHNGFLFKTASMARPITERKAREEFSRRWCMLNDGNFSYYESDKNSTPNGTLKSTEIVCLAVNTPERHGYDHTFELYSYSERIYLFGTDDPDSHREWVKSITKTFIPSNAEGLLRLAFERIGRLRYKDGLNLQSPRVGWFALVGSSLHAYLEDSVEEEEIHLRKLQELSIQQENEVLVLVERGRTLYIEGERKLDFQGWCVSMQRAAGSAGDSLSQQQLTETDIPVIVDRCIDYITQCGLTSEGIYRKSGVNSRVAGLCEAFRRDARSVRLKEGEHQVDDVSNTLKRFFRESGEGLFTIQAASAWLSTPVIPEESRKICQYQLLLSQLPRVNKATLRALVNHLYCVQRFAELNQMNLHNLAIVFGPTLFQSDGKDYTAGLVIEELIEHYTDVFEVDELQLKRQLDEITAIIKVREKLNHNSSVPASGSAGDFICTVYLEEKKETTEQHVKIPGSMTAAELTCEILDRRKIQVREKDYWSCWEVSQKEETGEWTERKTTGAAGRSARRRRLVSGERDERSVRRRRAVSGQRDERSARRRRRVSGQRDERSARRRRLVSGQRDERSARRRRWVSGERDERSFRRRRAVSGQRDERSARRRRLVSGERDERSVRRRRAVSGQRDERSARRRRLVSGQRDERSARRRRWVSGERDERSARRRRWVSGERDERSARRRRWVSGQRDERSARRRRWVSEQRDERSARRRRWVSGQRDERSVRRRRWVSGERDERSARRRRWVSGQRDERSARRRRWVSGQRDERSARRRKGVSGQRDERSVRRRRWVSGERDERSARRRKGVSGQRDERSARRRRWVSGERDERSARRRRWVSGERDERSARRRRWVSGQRDERSARRRKGVSGQRDERSVRRRRWVSGERDERSVLILSCTPLLPSEQPQFIRTWTLQSVTFFPMLPTVVSSWLDVLWVVDHS